MLEVGYSTHMRDNKTTREIEEKEEMILWGENILVKIIRCLCIYIYLFILFYFFIFYLFLFFKFPPSFLLYFRNLLIIFLLTLLSLLIRLIWSSLVNFLILR